MIEPRIKFCGACGRPKFGFDVVSAHSSMSGRCRVARSEGALSRQDSASGEM